MGFYLDTSVSHVYIKIVFLNLQENDVQGSFSNLTEFSLLLFSLILKTMIASFLRSSSCSSVYPYLNLLFPFPLVPLNFPYSSLFWWYYSIQICFYSVWYPVLVENSSRYNSRILWSKTALSFSVFTMDTLLPDTGVGNPHPLISAAALNIVYHIV